MMKAVVGNCYAVLFVKEEPGDRNNLFGETGGIDLAVMLDEAVSFRCAKIVDQLAY